MEFKKLTEGAIRALARDIVAAQRTAGMSPCWGKTQHDGMVANVVLAMAGMDPPTKAEFVDGVTAAAVAKREILLTIAGKAGHGIGGNSSQFRQWLNSADGLGAGTFPTEAVVDYV